MATLEPEAFARDSAPELTGGPDPIVGPKGWKRRLEDPFNTFYRYPVALGITRLLVHTRVTPNQVSLVQPLFAAAAGYLLTFDDFRAHVAAALLFETRSILDCVDGSLARAKKMSSPNGHAIDAMADWLGVVLLYAGIFHFVYHHPIPGVSQLTALSVVAVALLQGGLRSMAADYFKNKYLGIYERARDDVPELLREKLLGLDESASPFARIDAWIMRNGHLLFELERFDPSRVRTLSAAEIQKMSREEHSTKTKLIGFLWSISGGDAFLTFVIGSILLDRLWQGQVFFATVGCAWIVLVVVTNVAFIRSYRHAPAR
jgi:phosphatidylglycerophosphate synthase